MRDNTADASTNPADMLDLMRAQSRRALRPEIRAYTLILTTWAASWAIAFSALWSAERIGGNPWVRIPETAAWITFGAAMTAAIAVSIVTSVRSGEGRRGPSRQTDAMYGWAWTISMVGAWVLLVALIRAGMPAGILSLLAPALFVFLVGVMYLTGGIVWRSPAQYALGIVMIAVAIAATVAGAPSHYLVFATAGPFAMVGMAILLARGVIPLEGARR